MKRRRLKSKTEMVSSQRIDKWAALAGRWSFSTGKATYRGPDQKGVPIPLGLAVGSPPFRDGCLKTRVKLSQAKATTGGAIVGYSAITSPYIAIQIGAFDKAYAISEYRPNLGWTAIASAGLLENVDPAVGHELFVRLQGQGLSMSV